MRGGPWVGEKRGMLRVARAPTSMHRVKRYIGYIGYPISMAAAWCVSATGRYLWILEKHVHINEQPLDEYKRDP